MSKLKFPQDFKIQEVKLNHHYLLRQNHGKDHLLMRLVMTSPKGYNFLVEKHGRMMFSRSLFKRRMSSDDGDRIFLTLPNFFVIKETKVNKIKPRNKNVIIFGGAFDPFTIAHEDAVLALAKDAEFDEVWITPSYRHPEGKKMADFTERCKLIKNHFKNFAKVKVKTSEVGNYNGFTADLIEHLSADYPQINLFIAVGQDRSPLIHMWHNYKAIAKKVRFVSLTREGYAIDDNPLVYKSIKVRKRGYVISSTIVKELILLNASDKNLKEYIPTKLIKSTKEIWG